MTADPAFDQLVPEKRQRPILELLRERRNISVGAVEQQFGASASLVFLASPRAGKSTGNILNVDGGVALPYPR